MIDFILALITEESNGGVFILISYFMLTYANHKLNDETHFAAFCYTTPPLIAITLMLYVLPGGDTVGFFMLMVGHILTKDANLFYGIRMTYRSEITYGLFCGYLLVYDPTGLTIGIAVVVMLGLYIRIVYRKLLPDFYAYTN